MEKLLGSSTCIASPIPEWQGRSSRISTCSKNSVVEISTKGWFWWRRCGLKERVSSRTRQKTSSWRLVRTMNFIDSCWTERRILRLIIGDLWFDKVRPTFGLRARKIPLGVSSITLLMLGRKLGWRLYASKWSLSNKEKRFLKRMLENIFMVFYRGWWWSKVGW